VCVCVLLNDIDWLCMLSVYVEISKMSTLFDIKHIYKAEHVNRRISGCCFVAVKGMWEKKPSDWPKGVMFLDPNNKMKEQGEGSSKPTKEVLVPMLTHLVRKYVVGCLWTVIAFHWLIFVIIHFSCATKDVVVVNIVMLYPWHTLQKPAP